MSTNATALPACNVKDLALADVGKHRIEWAFQSMPVLQTIRKQFIKTQPLAGLRIAARLHVTSETANLMMTLRDGGANIVLCACNPISTQDDAAACLVRDYGIPVYAIKGESAEVSQSHLMATLDHQPQLTLDHSAGLTAALHTKRPELLRHVLAGTEETAKGVARVQAMAKRDTLEYPVIAVNDASSKRLFDNRYGTGQSTIDGIVRATNILLAGLNVVVAGYGWCGHGVAVRARGLGANVIVTEVNPAKAIEALMDGFRVMSMGDACAIGDVLITVTGSKGVIGRDHFDKLKSGAILCNAGHRDVEIDMEALAKAASSRREGRESVEEFAMRDGRKIYVLGGGRLINLAAGEGHPASVMDMSFANQALSAEYLVRNHKSLANHCFPVPEEIDKHIARMKLDVMGVKIDRLTIDQEQYLASWSEGTNA